ncbi:MAG: lactate racemase domain-containing protein [Lachnospiraceae bacterium]|nr:lactate racemase domain-containing protein [Lachnospiraceae bacterium]
MFDFNDYSVIEELLSTTKIPKMFKVKQHFSHNKLEDVAKETRIQLDKANLRPLLKSGMTIAVTASSRGIANQNVILKEVVSFLKENGTNPFIIPAMGSHGGATSTGQMEILSSYGITEEFCSCPIKSSMETVCIGSVFDDGKNLPVFIDKFAAQADGIVAVNRIKPHSAFRGPYESGITKMLCIGLGKQIGADSMHRDGFKYFKTRIPLFGNYVRTHTNVLFGVATIENAFDETNRIEVMKNSEIPIKEPELLKYAASLMPRILIDSTDVLIVKEIGKNFSGSGMDPNISGTWSTPYGSGGIKKQRTCVLDLSDASHGNGLGIGQADTTTLRFFNKMDFLSTYPNALTSTVFLPVKLAMVLKNDEMAIKGAIKTCNEIDTSNAKIVMIENTLSIEEIYLSSAFLDEIKYVDGIEILSDCMEVPFDNNGNMLVWNKGENQ